MKAYDEYLEKWEHPADYRGVSPDGDYVIYSRNRDSSILENNNYELILEKLEKLDTEHNQDIDDNSVYDFRASHWAVGWVEYIIVSSKAPIQVLDACVDIVSALSDYPVIDDMAYSDAQHEAVSDYWESINMQEKIEWCNESGDSIFYARHSIPESIYQSEMFY